MTTIDLSRHQSSELAHERHLTGCLRHPVRIRRRRVCRGEQTHTQASHHAERPLTVARTKSSSVPQNRTGETGVTPEHDRRRTASGRPT